MQETVDGPNNPWFVESVQDFTYICCPQCIYKTKDESRFQNHAIKNHPQSYVLFHSEIKFEEPICEINVKKGDTSDISAVHEADTSVTQCVTNTTECDTSVTTCDTDVTQVKQEHYDEDTNYDTNFKEEQVSKEECPVCHKMFDTSYLLTHMRCFHGSYETKKYNPLKIKGENFSENVEMIDKRKQFKCHTCETIFYSQHELAKHQTENHEIKPKYTCVVCEIDFYTSSERTSHNR